MRRGPAALLAIVMLAQHAGTAADKRGPASKPIAAYSLAGLGLRGVPTLYALLSRNQEMTLDFLDEHRVLLTFNLHKLLPRDERPPAHADRAVQAEVVNLDDGSIERKRTLVLHDGRAYLWPLGDGEFLLRVGNQFQLMNAQLETTDAFHADGAIVWVQTDPAANFAAVISEYEQHTPEEHARLQHEQLFGPESAPAEREEVTGFRIRPEMARIFHGQVPQPGYVSGSAEWYVRADTSGDERYSILLKPWPGASSEANIVATVRSSCTPVIQVLSQTAMLVHSCDDAKRKVSTIGVSRDTAGHWVGKPLWSGEDVVSQHVQTNIAGNAKILLEPTLTPFRAEDEKHSGAGSMTARDAATGATLLTIPLQPLYGFRSVADASPNGDKLAVLNNGELQVYALPKVKAGAEAPAAKSQTPKN